MSTASPATDRRLKVTHPDALCVVAGCATSPTKSGACSRHSYALRYIPADEQPWMGPAKDRPKKCQVNECVFPRYGHKKHCFKHHARMRATGSTAERAPRHYAPTCAIAYCEAPSETLSLCSAHAQTLASGRWAMVRDESPRYCLDDCGELTWAAGRCRLHYARLRNDTPIDAPRRACMEPTCDETSVDRRRCATHLAEYIAGDPGRVFCTATDCEKNVIARGLCSAHYYAARRAGTLDQHTTRGQGPTSGPGPCPVPDCDQVTATKGVCKTHYDKARYRVRRDGVTILAAIDALCAPATGPSAGPVVTGATQTVHASPAVSAA